MALTTKDVERITVASGQNCQLKHDVMKAAVMSEVDQKIDRLADIIQVLHDTVHENTQLLRGIGGNNGVIGTQKKHAESIESLLAFKNYWWAIALSASIFVGALDVAVRIIFKI